MCAWFCRMVYAVILLYWMADTLLLALRWVCTYIAVCSMIRNYLNQDSLSLPFPPTVPHHPIWSWKWSETLWEAARFGKRCVVSSSHPPSPWRLQCRMQLQQRCSHYTLPTQAEDWLMLYNKNDSKINLFRCLALITVVLLSDSACSFLIIKLLSVHTNIMLSLWPFILLLVLWTLVYSTVVAAAWWYGWLGSYAAHGWS